VGQPRLDGFIVSLIAGKKLNWGNLTVTNIQIWLTCVKERYSLGFWTRPDNMAVNFLLTSNRSGRQVIVSKRLLCH
jgi:hypothetical protein